MSQETVPQMNRANPPTHGVEITDEAGRVRQAQIVSEFPLTLKVNHQELVTLMTLGTDPEDLVLGYLRNQHLVTHCHDVVEIRVDWEQQAVLVKTRDDRPLDLKSKTARKVVTSGCGEGTVFSCSLDKIYEKRLSPFSLKPVEIYGLLRKIKQQSHIYAIAGSVHTCALCSPSLVLIFVEDVGRHNAADTIAGKMWRNNVKGIGKILYTTGRVTSEIVIKAAMMNISTLLSRSGVTKMGLDIAQDLDMTLIARAKGKKFQVYNGHDYIDHSI